MFKKSLILTLVCIVLLGLAGCGKAEETNSTKSPSTPSPVKTVAPTLASTVAKTSTPTKAPTPTPTAVASTAVKEYSIELDFKISEKVVGVVFGYEDATSFLMWQVNIFDMATEEKVCLRPHRWVDGTPEVIEQIDISNAIKWADKDKKHHMKITVSASNEIITYINNVKVHTIKDNGAAFGMYGFRECQDEAAYVDNLVVTNTATKKAIAQYTFDSDDDNPFDEGEVNKDAMGNPSLYIAALSSSAADLSVIE